MKELAAAILRVLTEKGHSFQDAADEMSAYKGRSISKGSVSAWSKGFLTNRPAEENWDAIAQYVGVSRFEVMGWLEVLEPEDVDTLLNRAMGVLLRSGRSMVPAA